MAEGPVTLTIKAGSGFEEPWLVISGEDYEAVQKRLATVPGVTEAHLQAVQRKFINRLEAWIGIDVEAAFNPDVTVGEVQTGAEASNQTFDVCPKCGKPKDKMVAAGTSKRPPYKKYPAFYTCSTPGCPGR